MTQERDSFAFGFAGIVALAVIVLAATTWASISVTSGTPGETYSPGSLVELFPLGTVEHRFPR